jgi:ankyrin repeat protein
MARPERWRLRGWRAGLLAAVLQAGASVAQAATASAANFEALEPAKAAIRVKDYNRAAQLLSNLAGQGNPGAEYLLGSLVMNGLGVPVDRARARQLFESAADVGEARAAYGLAALLATDDPPDPSSARRWLARAAELGDLRAMELARSAALPLGFAPAEVLADESLRRSALWRAAANGDVATVAELAVQERVNAADEFGRTALHRAAGAGATDAVDLLLSRGAAFDVTDHYGVTPLMLACGTEQARTCSRLLHAKANVGAVDRGGNSALVYALRAGRSSQARELMAAGAAPVRVKQGMTAIAQSTAPSRAAVDAYSGWPDVAVAASRTNSEWLRELLQRGADPNARTPAGDTPLLVAVSANSSSAVIALLDAGADPSQANPRGVAPLELAVRQGLDEPVRALLEHTRVSEGGMTPRVLIAAVERGSPAMVRQLLAGGADPNATGKDQPTPLSLAAARGHDEIVNLLLAANAAPSTADAAGRSALWMASCNGSSAMIASLLKAGAAIDAADRDGLTPLACAAARGHSDAVERLSRAGANLAARDRNGDTPLTLAAAGGRTEAIRRLLAAGADLDAQNQHGDTALILATQSRDSAAVQALLVAGADRRLRNRDGVAAADAARARGFGDVVALLGR